MDISEEMHLLDTPDVEFIPRMAKDIQGNYHLVFSTGISGSPTIEVHYMKFSSSGETLAGPVKISPSGMDTLNFADVAVDQGGRAHIAFDGFAPGENSPDIYYSKVGADGRISVAAKRVFDNDGYSGMAQIGADRAGNAYIVWESDYTDIRWMKISSGGALAEEAIVVSDELGWGGETGSPGVAVAPDGTSHIVWHQKDYEVSRWAIYDAVVSSGGEGERAPRRVVHDLRVDSFWPSIDIDEDEVVHMTYLTDDPIQGMSVQFLSMDVDGDVLDEMTIVDPSLGDPEVPTIDAFPNGDVAIAYSYQNNPLADGIDLEIRILGYSYDTFFTIQLDRYDHEYYSPTIGAGDEEVGVVYVKNDDLYFKTVSLKNNPPVPELSVSDSNPDIDEPVTFDGSDSYDPDSGDQVSEYLFDWGDGLDSGWTTSSSTVHSYSASGTYTARLHVRDSEGMESEDPATVTVQVSTATQTNRPPIARMTASPVEVRVGELVTFDGSLSSDQDGSVQHWSFNYGDTQSTGWVTTSIQTHTYSTSGMYTATLRVKDDDGSVSENTAQVSISVARANEPPTATIVSITPPSAYEHEEVTLEGLGEDPDGTVDSYEWRSSLDGLLGNQASITIDMLQVGTHTIAFKVQDNDGEWSEEATGTLVVKINSPPTLLDITEDTRASEGKSFEFKVLYTDPDDDMPTSARLYYTKGNIGVYQSKDLEVEDSGDFNCTDGKVFCAKIKFDRTGQKKYYFEFENGKNPKMKTAVKEIEVTEKHSSTIPSVGGIGTLSILLLCAIGIASAQRRRLP